MSAYKVFTVGHSYLILSLRLIIIVFVIVSFVMLLASTSVTNPATVELCEADIVNVDIYWGLFDILLGSFQKFRMI